MKILFYRYNNICEMDIMEVFRKCNIDICEDTTELTLKDKAPSEKLKEFGKNYIKENELGTIDYIFSINFFPYISEFCEKLNLTYVCWSVDSPVLELYSESIRNSCNRVFLFDEAQYQEIVPYNPEHIFYLPLATNVGRWDRELSSLTAKDEQEYASDISFVGSLYHEKSPLSLLKKELPLPEYFQGYVKGIAEAQMSVYGYNLLQDVVTPQLIAVIKQGFPDFYKTERCVKDLEPYVTANYYLGMLVSEMERVRVLNALAVEHQVTVYTRSDTSLLRNVNCKPGITTHVQMPRVFHLSKINLNITMKGIQTGLPLRIWDVLGCGGFLLTNYQAEIPAYLEIGKDLECYESIEDCLAKAKYYLQHDDLRREIAANGYRKVKAMHTYEHRVLEMLSVLLKV